MPIERVARLTFTIVRRAYPQTLMAGLALPRPSRGLPTGVQTTKTSSTATLKTRRDQSHGGRICLLGGCRSESMRADRWCHNGVGRRRCPSRYSNLPLASYREIATMFSMRSKARSCLILLVGAAHAQSASAAWPPQFDLVCAYQGSVTADPHPRGRGFPDERTWRGDFRYVVDLRNRRFCDIRYCREYGAFRIAATNASRITFHNQQGSRSRNWLYETVRNRDGYYLHRTGDEEGYLRESAGSCRRARFSGFPVGTRSAQ
jgi:hypothetical protein